MHLLNKLKFLLRKQSKLPVDDLKQLKAKALKAYEAAIERANPFTAVQSCIRKYGLPEPKSGGKTLVIGVGKAAPAMINGLRSHINGPNNCICITHKENKENVDDCEMFKTGHPVPNETGALASKQVITELKKTDKNDQVLFLVSGGGSALMPAPVDGVTLEDKIALNEVLLSNGLNIDEMNHIRQQISKLKGGGLLYYADPTPVTSYILSDVIGNDLRVVASGPTVSPLGTTESALEILAENDLLNLIPENIRKFLMAGKAKRQGKDAVNYLIGDNRESIRASAEALGNDFLTSIEDKPLVGDVNEAAATIYQKLKQAEVNVKPTAIVWGGETTVKIKGNGLGGRNQELALIVAKLANECPVDKSWAFLSAGTDGRDGPTEAAGAIIDQQTCERILQSGYKTEDFLMDNNSNAALEISEDLVHTGATGTNVADVQILVVS